MQYKFSTIVAAPRFHDQKFVVIARLKDTCNHFPSMSALIVCFRSQNLQILSRTLLNRSFLFKSMSLRQIFLCLTFSLETRYFFGVVGVAESVLGNFHSVESISLLFFSDTFFVKVT